MATLTVTARGQVTFKKEVLQHLGIKPGEKIEINSATRLAWANKRK
jgi:bifunctional DNA-binding transcriptional regulator/antitoxin component of YhaV-PrlF toxin-antitoxin module